MRGLVDKTPMHHFSETAREIEFSRMGITCGFQDFYATTFGGIAMYGLPRQTALARTDRRSLATVEPLLEPDAELPFVLAHTGRQRDSGETHRPLRSRWVEGDPDVRAAMRALGSMARKAKRHVLARNWPAVGAAMNAAHRQIAAVGGSGSVVDALTERAIKLGAHGAKLAGAARAAPSSRCTTTRVAGSNYRRARRGVRVSGPPSGARRPP